MSFPKNPLACTSRTLAFLLALIVPAAQAQGWLEIVDSIQVHKQTPQTWAARGGTLVMSFNTDLVREAWRREFF